MAYCCTSKQHETNFINRETADLVQRTNFSANEINDLRNRSPFLTFICEIFIIFKAFIKFQIQTKNSAKIVLKRTWDFLDWIQYSYYQNEFFN